MNKTDLSRRETRCSLPSFALFAADQCPWSSNLLHLVPQSSSQQKVLPGLRPIRALGMRLQFLFFFVRGGEGGLEKGAVVSSISHVRTTSLAESQAFL